MDAIYFFFLACFIAVLIGSYANLVQLPVSNISDFILYYVFLNATHTLFTFVLLVTLPEFRRWLRETLLSTKMLIIAPAFLLLFFRATHEEWEFAPGVAEGVLLFVVSLRTLHNVSQTKGLSLLYNKFAPKDMAPDERQMNLRTEKNERILFQLLTLAILILALLQNFAPWEGPNVRWAWLPCLLISGGLFLNSTRYTTRTKKPLFLIGTVFLALSPFSYVAFFLQRCLHGLEYTFISVAMIARSRLQKTFLTLLGLGISIVTLYFTLLMLHGWIPAPPKMGFMMRASVALAFLIEYGHYYMDSLLFRWSDPVVRAEIAPLMVDGISSLGKPARVG